MKDNSKDKISDGMKVDSSQRNFTDGSIKEPRYVFPKDEDIFRKNGSEEIREPYVLLSRDFSSSEIVLVYHYKTSHTRY